MQFMESKHQGLFYSGVWLASALWFAVAPVMAQVADESNTSSSVFAPIESMQIVFENATGTDAALRTTSWERISALDAADREALVQQLALFSRDASSTKKAMLVGVVIKKYAMSESDVVGALVPMLAVEDVEVHRAVEGMLAAYEDKSATRPADFSAYRVIIEDSVREQREIPAGLVEHMFHVDPGVALRTMMRGMGMHDPKELREMLWAEHMVAEVIWKQTHGFLNRTEVSPEAMVQLKQLSNHSQWWARMYVPAIMHHHRSFRSVEILERLEGDANPQVAQFAKSVLAKSP